MVGLLGLATTKLSAHSGNDAGLVSYRRTPPLKTFRATSINRAPTAGTRRGRKDQPEPNVTGSNDRTTGPMFQEGSTLASYKLYVGCIVL
jgi:hypothetical protein